VAVPLPVPGDKVGKVIGRGGVTINGIQFRCAVKVEIPSENDLGNPLTRTLTIQ